MRRSRKKASLQDVYKRQGIVLRPVGKKGVYFVLRSFSRLKGYGGIVKLDFIVLLIQNVGNRITKPESGHHQGGTAADPQKHHDHPTLIAEAVADGDFAQKGQPVPQGSYPFQKNPFRCV